MCRFLRESVECSIKMQIMRSQSPKPNGTMYVERRVMELADRMMLQTAAHCSLEECNREQTV